MKKVTLKRGRKEIVTREKLISAKARGIDRRGLSVELGTSYTAICSGCRRHQVILPADIPPTEAERKGKVSTSVAVCSAVMDCQRTHEPFHGAELALSLNVSRQRVGAIVEQLRACGQEI